MAGLMAASSLSVTKEAVSKQKTKKTVKKNIKKTNGKFTTDKNKVLKTKQLQMIKEKATIVKTPTCECVPPQSPEDVHPSTQF